MFDERAQGGGPCGGRGERAAGSPGPGSAGPGSDDVARWRALVDDEVGRLPEGFWAAQRAAILVRLETARRAAERAGPAATGRRRGARGAGRRAVWIAAAAAGLAAAAALWLVPDRTAVEPAGDGALLADVARLASGAPPVALEPLAAGLDPAGPSSAEAALPSGLERLVPPELMPAVPDGPWEEWFGGDDDETA